MKKEISVIPYKKVRMHNAEILLNEDKIQEFISNGFHQILVSNDLAEKFFGHKERCKPFRIGSDGIIKAGISTVNWLNQNVLSNAEGESEMFLPLPNNKIYFCEW